MIFPFLVLGAITSIFAFGMNALRENRKQMQSAGATLGMQWHGSAFSLGFLSGTVNGLAVRVDTVNRSGGGSEKTVTRYRVSYPSLGLGLKISKETVLHRFAQAFRPDIEVGETGFDRAVSVRGTSGDAVRAFLTPERREAVLNIIAASPTAVVTDEAVEIRSNRVDRKADLIVTRVRRLAMLAGDISDAAPPPRVATMRTRRAAHDLAGAAQAAREELSADPWLGTRREAAEILYAAGDAAGAGAEYRALERELPRDPEMTAMAERALERPRPQPRPEAPPVPAVETAESLFGGQLLGYQVNVMFDEGLRGRRVAWTGTVERVRKTDPGRMAVTVLIHTIDHPLFGPTEVVAVADVPRDPRLDDRIGGPVSVTGVLGTVDALMRAFYLTEAAVM